MPKIVRVKMDDNQLGVALDIINDWNKDPKLQDLLEILEAPADEEAGEIVNLQVSASITFDQWNEFCQEVGIKAPFPSF